MVPPLLTKLNTFSPLKTRNVSATAQHFLCAARKSIHKVRLLTSTNRQLSKKTPLYYYFFIIAFTILAIVSFQPEFYKLF